jgi:N-acetylneuraminic acid mutarotase
MNKIIDNILNTPTHVREAQQKAIDSDTIYVNIASGKTEREAGVMTRDTYRLTRRRNYGTCLSRISPYRA